MDPEPPAHGDDTGVRIGICAGAEYGPAKRWPLERFAEVANDVGEKTKNATFLLFGVPKEKELADELEALLTVPNENMVGKTTMAEFLNELRTCHLVVTNDTGTMHLAAALGVPTISIFGSTEPAFQAAVSSQDDIVDSGRNTDDGNRRGVFFG